MAALEKFYVQSDFGEFGYMGDGEIDCLNINIRGQKHAIHHSASQVSTAVEMEIFQTSSSNICAQSQNLHSLSRFGQIIFQHGKT